MTNDGEIQTYNRLYDKLAKFGIDLKLYDEVFDSETNELRFYHKYHQGWTIVVSESTGILLCDFPC